MKNTSFSFCIDSRLMVSSWGEDAMSVTGRPAVDAIGKKYYKVVPRILVNDRDAVITALRSGKPFAIRGYYFSNIVSHVKADIHITPVPLGANSGAQVRVILGRGCQGTASEKLIDTGKAAVAFVHSVRNPLNAIKGAVIYLRKKYSQENTLVEFTDLIETEVARLDEFVTKFLSASSTEAEAAETDINEVLRKIELLTSFQARLRKINPTYSYGDIPVVVVSSFQIEQAILNIVNNAVEALGPGGGITVRTGLKSCPGSDFVFVEISDTGPGIPQPGPRELAKRIKKGKGFGLMITREIIAQNGGQLEISSSKGCGTVITILLPARSAGAEQSFGIS